MSVTLINPPGLVEPQGYTQVAVATGSRTVYVAGQVSQDAEGKVVGTGDLAAQVAQAMLNVGLALEAAGGSFADVVKTTIYVVDLAPEKQPQIFEGFGRVAPQLGITQVGPTTVIGVQSLASPEILVEFDVTAVLG